MAHYATPLHPVIFTLEALWVHGLELTDRDRSRQVLIELKQLAQDHHLHQIHSATLSLTPDGVGLLAKIDVVADQRGASTVTISHSLPIHYLG